MHLPFVGFAFKNMLIYFFSTYFENETFLGIKLGKEKINIKIKPEDYIINKMDTPSPLSPNELVDGEDKNRKIDLKDPARREKFNPLALPERNYKTLSEMSDPKWFYDPNKKLAPDKAINLAGHPIDLTKHSPISLWPGHYWIGENNSFVGTTNVPPAPNIEPGLMSTIQINNARAYYENILKAHDLSQFIGPANRFPIENAKFQGVKNEIERRNFVFDFLKKNPENEYNKTEATKLAVQDKVWNEAFLVLHKELEANYRLFNHGQEYWKLNSKSKVYITVEVWGNRDKQIIQEKFVNTRGIDLFKPHNLTTNSPEYWVYKAERHLKYSDSDKNTYISVRDHSIKKPIEIQDEPESQSRKRTITQDESESKSRKRRR